MKRALIAFCLTGSSLFSAAAGLIDLTALEAGEPKPALAMPECPLLGSSGLLRSVSTETAASVDALEATTYDDGVPLFIDLGVLGYRIKAQDPRISRIAFFSPDLLEIDTISFTVFDVSSLDELVHALRVKARYFKSLTWEETKRIYSRFGFQFKDKVYEKFEDLLALTETAPEGMNIVVRILLPEA